MSIEGDWVSASETRRLIDPTGLGAGPLNLSDHVKAGRARIRAEDTARELFTNLSRDRELTDFGRLLGSSAATLRWFWSCGDLHVVTQDKYGRSSESKFYDVHFDRETLKPFIQSVAPSRLPPSRGGAPRSSNMWDALTVELVVMADEGLLRNFPTQAALRTELLKRLDAEGFFPSDETIKPLVRRVWTRAALGGEN